MCASVWMQPQSRKITLSGDTRLVNALAAPEHFPDLAMRYAGSSAQLTLSCAEGLSGPHRVDKIDTRGLEPRTGTANG
jgi:hypothetical protein